MQDQADETFHIGYGVKSGAAATAGKSRLQGLEPDAHGTGLACRSPRPSCSAPASARNSIVAAARRPTVCVTLSRHRFASSSDLQGWGWAASASRCSVSVRSGAAVSMPGMMETILDVGLNDATVRGLLRLTGNPRLAWDSLSSSCAVLCRSRAPLPC